MVECKAINTGEGVIIKLQVNARTACGLDYLTYLGKKIFYNLILVHDIMT